ncbi:zf-DHHC-domain-containing protein [Coemansia reversa NRRL 1564]|uniref:Palmitoyltransferase n=1 Tax=Coemansia reversa (strain ATCC 12441 / NRRL 1564) TaxID=763665 RepID=A0A2G5B237_COERN|nr:zf-DHHC-domain-containing protein [Coemansia reversa NRRL 1564]|eukprot:PIA13083.1 zf-DHHC-domain-containing protein [Coemansia reversa NRRL 1564]
MSVWCYIICVSRSPGTTAAHATTISSHGGMSNSPPSIRLSRRRNADTVNTGFEDSDSSDGSTMLTDSQRRESGLINTITVRDDGEPRYCHKCCAPKPDRAHHCSICDVCVLRMDHHCPWLGSQCVGFRTHKAFVLFLVYTALYTLLLFILAFFYYGLPLFNAAEFSYEDAGEIIMVLLLIFLAFLFSLLLIGFSAFHLYLVANNQTTLEHDGRNNYRVEGSNEIVWRSKINLFDLGHRKNFEQIFGTSRKLWFVPMYTTIGDGIRYPISFEHYNELQNTA